MTPAPLELLDAAGVAVGRPRFWSLVGAELRYHPAPDREYTATLTYYVRIPALGDARPTNWLLVAHPDLYLFGSLKEAAPFLRALGAYPALRVRGLMTLAMFSADADRVRACFAGLRTLRDRLRQDAPADIVLDELSMGMSGDFELAIAEGATTVRVGTAIFGRRPTPDSAYWPGFAGSGAGTP